MRGCPKSSKAVASLGEDGLDIASKVCSSDCGANAGADVFAECEALGTGNGLTVVPSNVTLNPGADVLTTDHVEYITLAGIDVTVVLHAER